MPLRPADLSAPATDTGVRVDHMGIVVRDLQAEVATWRGAGFLVSDPVPLMGADGDGRPVPLGQWSAHVVFANAYVELSSPVPGSGNHLEPYLAAGDGVRILVLRAADAGAAAGALAAGGEVPAVRHASRAVTVEGAARDARFRWFPLPFDAVPAVLSAVVEHVTPELVFHAEFRAHPNGLARVRCFMATGDEADLHPRTPRGDPGTEAPPLVIRDAPHRLRLDGVVLADGRGGEAAFRLDAVTEN